MSVGSRPGRRHRDAVALATGAVAAGLALGYAAGAAGRRAGRRAGGAAGRLAAGRSGGRTDADGRAGNSARPGPTASDVAWSQQHVEEADRMRTDFVAAVSDELRTPLTNILGYAELLAEGDLGELSPSQLNVLAVVDRNGRRLLSVVEDLILLSRIRGRTAPGTHGAVDVAELVRQAVLTSSASLVDRDLTLAVVVADGVGAVPGHRDQLVRLLANLLANAVAYTPDGRAVTLTAARSATHLTLRVADTGIGIDRADQQRLFEPFCRIRPDRRSSGKGAGLGLATVHAIVEAHGGDLGIDSAPGAGTAVTVTLPLDAARPGAAAPVPAARPAPDDGGTAC